MKRSETTTGLDEIFALVAVVAYHVALYWLLYG